MRETPQCAILPSPRPVPRGRIRAKGDTTVSSRGIQLLEEALKLPPEERAELIERLASSLDPADRKRIDELWGLECEARLDALDAGRLSSAPAARVFDEIDRRKRG